MKSIMHALQRQRGPTGLPAALSCALLLVMLASPPIQAAQHDSEVVLPDPNTLALPLAPAEEMQAMFAAADKASRIIESAHADETRKLLLRERARMADQAAASISLADQVIRKETATIETMQEKVHVTLPKPYSKPVKNNPAPPKQWKKHSASTRVPVNQNINAWLATTDIQQPLKGAVVNEPSPSEVQASLEAAMDEISHWPGHQVAGKSLDR